MGKDNEKVPEVLFGNRQVFTITESLASPVMPLGTKYVFFDKKYDAEEGVEVVAKGYSGLRRGVITAVTDQGIIEINEHAGFIRDVLYRVVE